MSLENYDDVLKHAECLHTADEISTALDQMAEAITHQLKDSYPIILGVMTGALIPLGHLLTRLLFPLEIDYIHATRYHGQLRGGDLHWLVEPRVKLKDRHV